MPVYYNEIDPFKAAVLREAIQAGAIAAGDVDERSIADVQPADLMGYAQCHFFAGGGFWSLAARLAGWPDDEPLWTASTPCPSFSAAGKGLGFADPRHLWPHVARLVRECRPRVLAGEQVAAAIGHGWLDLVSTDLEAEGYAVAAAVLGAHSVGAPHIRQRLYFVAVDDTASARRDRAPQEAERDSWDGTRLRLPGAGCGTGELVHAEGGAAAGEPGRVADADGGNASAEGLQRGREHGQQPQDGGTSRLADASSLGRDGWPSHEGRRTEQRNAFAGGSEAVRPSPLNGFWRDADWILCRDGKWRPVEPGTFPLATGYPARVGLLRLAGDAINVEAARAFLEAYRATRGE